MIALRRIRMTADEIAACLEMAPRTVSRILARAGLSRLVSAKVEDDSDIHLVIADPATGGTMIAEIPKASCARKAPSWAKAAWTKARATLATCKAVGTSWTYYPAGASATLTGVGFKDKMHGQRGVAPNGVELHPVSSITALRCG